MSETNWANLGCHTHYSYGKSCVSPSSIVTAAKNAGMTCVGISDFHSLAGVPEFVATCKKEKMDYVIGLDVLVDLPSSVSGFAENMEASVKIFSEGDGGWMSLKKVAEHIHRYSSRKSDAADIQFLSENSEGLIVVAYPEKIEETEDMSSIEEFGNVLGFLQSQFDVGNFYVSETPELTLAGIMSTEELSVMPVFINNVFYCKESDKDEIQIPFLCVSEKKTLADVESGNVTEIIKKNQNSTGHVLTLKEAESFLSESNFAEAIENTKEIIARCKNINVFRNKGQLPIPKWASKYPNADKALREETFNGAKSKWKEIPTERIEHELGVIARSGYSSYFLIVADVVNWAKKQGIAIGPGRGSAAGCAVAYSLGITAVDPLKHDLIFERFLNEGRKQMPDIDIDYDDTRRADIVNYLKSAYPDDQVANVITHTFMRSKNSVRDACRISGITTNDEQGALTKFIPDGIAGQAAPLQILLRKMHPQNDENMRKIWGEAAKLRELYASDEQYKSILNIAKKLEGSVRNHSIHAAAIILGDRPLLNFVPTFIPENSDALTTMWEAYDCEKAGLLKLDVLGSLVIRVVDVCMKQIGITPADIPEDDPATMEMLGRGDTIGVFQMESNLCREVCRELKPKTFDDIVAINALIRPGPLSHDMHKKYAQALLGNFAHYNTLPERGLEELLAPTYGLLLYQEQVMQLAVHYGGFTLLEADELRRTMGKKDRHGMANMKRKFSEGCEDNGYPISVAEKLWEWVAPFSSYGFPKAHAVGYGYVAYWTAWLSCHHTASFFTTIANAVTDFDRANKFLIAAKSRGINILPPSFSEPYIQHTATDNGKNIRYGLSRIKGVGSSLNAVEDDFIENGEYKSMEDIRERLADKTPLLFKNKRVWEALASAGCFSGFGFEREEAYEYFASGEFGGKRGNISPDSSLFVTEEPEIASDTKEAKTTKTNKTNLKTIAEVCGMSFGTSIPSDVLLDSAPKDKPCVTIETAMIKMQQKSRRPIRIIGRVDSKGAKTGFKVSQKTGKEYYRCFLTDPSGDASLKIQMMKMIPDSLVKWDEPRDGEIIIASGSLGENIFFADDYEIHPGIPQKYIQTSNEKYHTISGSRLQKSTQIGGVCIPEESIIFAENMTHKPKRIKQKELQPDKTTFSGRLF